MTTTQDTGSDTSPNDHGLPTARTSNLRWILGIGGGAIGGVFVGIANYDAFPIGVLLFLAIGATVGAAVPPAGSLAGLGAFVAVVIGITSQSDKGFLLCPLLGGGVGLLWSIAAWTWRRKLQRHLLPSDQEAAVIRQDRIRLAQASLVAGLVLGVVFGFTIGGPFLVAGPFFGAIVGGSIFIGLTISAYISGRRK